MGGMNCSAVIPGSYDPITLGHIDLIKRAVDKFDKLYLVVARSFEKSYLLTTEDRLNLIRLSLEESGLSFDNIVIDSFDGLTIDYCIKHDVQIIIRGIRGEEDLKKEGIMARTNFILGEDNNIDTFILLSNSRYTSSSIVKELLKVGIDQKRLEQFVTKKVAIQLKKRFK